MTNHDGSGDAPGQANHKYNKLIDDYKSKLNQYTKKKIPFEELKDAETKLCDYYVNNSSALRFYEKIFKEKLIWPEDIIKKSKEFPLIKPLDIEKIKKRVEERKNKTPKKYVITGGPSSGKSCLVYALQLQNFYAINEVAQKYISLQQAKGISKPWEDPKFETQLYLKQKQQEDLYNDKTLFLDRSLIDVYVYAQMMEQDVPDELKNFVIKEKICPRKTYDKVFYVSPLKKYVKEEYRRESESEARRAGEKIKNFYEELGYTVIRIPDVGIENRVNFILENCK
ncbi:MAG: ATP-binding protein [Candidatus Nanoarchaeia archaeon]|nr:ATP-binding protein [Candidatus Nanoarchaeia archaeon]